MSKRFLKTKFLLVFLIIGLIAVIAQPPAEAASLNSNWTTTTPTIDGVISNNEWNGSHTNSFTTYAVLTQVPAFQVSFWAMNDADNLYLCIQWPDPTHTGAGDVLYLFFDENNDGNWSTPANENAMQVYITPGSTSFMDGYGVFMMGVFPDSGSQDGLANGTWASNYYTLEIAIPINCTDAEDLQPGAGDVMGISLIWLDGDPMINYEYPLDSAYGTTTSFKLASAPLVGTPLTFAFLLSTLVGITIITIHVKKKALPPI